MVGRFVLMPEISWTILIYYTRRGINGMEARLERASEAPFMRNVSALPGLDVRHE